MSIYNKITLLSKVTKMSLYLNNHSKVYKYLEITFEEAVEGFQVGDQN